MDLTFFNPHNQSEPDFLANFVARGEVLDYFLRQLRLLSKSEPARHHLIVAPRGYGKTSLLRRLAIAVRTDADLTAKLIPLTFREEQHNVISLDVFWRNCLQSLAEAREDEQAPAEEVRELDAAWVKHAPRQTLGRDEQDGEPAWRDFQAYCMRLGRRPLLLIDNIDSLLAGLPAKHHWSLRGILQQESGPVLIAAAPQFPESVHDPSAAFYDFFRVETLDKLSDFEVTRCLRTMARRRGEPGKAVLDLLDKEPGRIAALNTLAGGNPRTLNVLYSVLESHMSADLLSQLSAMLDTFTSWYHSRTDTLPTQARAVFDALALNWDPMTAAAVGTVTGLDITAVSSQISRLEKAGFVEAVALNRRGKGRSGYQLSERFFNIWYLMRNGPRRTRQSIRFLAVFLQSCFSTAERRSLAGKVMTTTLASPAYALGLAASLPASALRDRLLAYTETQSSLAGESEEYGATIQEMRRAGRRPRKQREEPEPERELARLDRAIRRLERAANHENNLKLAKTLVEKGDTLRQLTRFEQALELYDSVSSRYADASDPALHEQVAMALFDKAVTLGELGRLEQEVETYDNMVARFGDAVEPALREHVAMALFNKGVSLGELGRHEEEVETYDDVVARFGDAVEPALLDQVALALFNKGVTLGQLGRHAQEIETYDNIVARFGDAAEPVLREQVADALVNKGYTLGQLGRHEQAIETYDNVLARFGDVAESALHEQVAVALVNKGHRLEELGRHEQAAETYSDVLARFGDAAEPALREQVAMALVSKGYSFWKLGRQEQAVETYDGIVARFGDAAEPALREQVTMALVYKGDTLAELGRHGQAIEAFEGVLTRFSDAPEPSVRELVDWVLLKLSVSLVEMGQPQRAAATLRQAATAAATGKLRAIAWGHLGNLLLDFLGDPAAATEAFESGQTADADSEIRALLHTNNAYAMILHGGDPAQARDHLRQALADDGHSPAGQHLLDALRSLQESPSTPWPQVFDHIGRAIESGDANLMSTYLSDLQRLLWFTIASGQGESLQRWMEQRDYAMRYAPLYHAVRAAIDGEDLLLQINPETRQAAVRIHEGIARMLKLYGRRDNTGRPADRQRSIGTQI